MSASASPVVNGRPAEPESPLSAPLELGENAQLSSAEDGDLFGDQDESSLDAEPSEQTKLDDSELDSSNDEGRRDRLAETVEGDVMEEEEPLPRVEKVLNSTIARIKPPEAEELYLLNMPPFLGLRQKCFDPATYEPPKRPHDAEEESDHTSDPNFSAFSTAATSFHWRHDPRYPEKLQSNARIIRWSDGSLTLQIASSPKDQYRVTASALRQGFGKSRKQATHTGYDPGKDAQVYLAAPHVEESIHQIVAPVDAALKILPTGDLADESVIKLQLSLAANMNVHDPLTALKQVKEDPELAKKAAELFEKDRMRSTRRREAAEERLLTRKDRVLGRSGLGRGGLSVAGLEDEDGMPSYTPGGRTGGRNKLKKRRTNRQGIIYSDDEDEGMPRGRTREDEYDEDDGFLVGSDEEPETYESGGGEEPDAEGEDEDPDVDDLVIEGRQTVLESSTRGGERDRNRDERDRKRRTPSETPGEKDGVQGSPGLGRKKRRVIDDDDDE